MLLEADVGQGRRGVLLTKRSGQLSTHPGEIALPGGMQDASDADLWHTARREAEEEVGVQPASLGHPQALPPSYTRRGVKVFPFVANWLAPHGLVLNEAEIAYSFWMPVDFLLSDPRIRTDIFVRNGQEFWAPVYRFEGEVVWGFTARVLLDYVNRCFNAQLDRRHRAPEARHKSI